MVSGFGEGLLYGCALWVAVFLLLATLGEAVILIFLGFGDRILRYSLVMNLASGLIGLPFCIGAWITLFGIFEPRLWLLYLAVWGASFPLFVVVEGTALALLTKNSIRQTLPAAAIANLVGHGLLLLGLFA
ncbi:MAG: hypothetical protein NZM11_02995 [Anaerolineales bacterium]|nr:hypothetical protein [Anaerolineales bacterium]MDW8325783.1 hypothetical protein [Anaerolineales bacterium]